MRRLVSSAGFAVLLAGVVVASSGGATQVEARWVIRDLGTLGGKGSGDFLSGGPAAINQQGQIVGSSDTRRGTTHAFLWENGKMRDLRTLGGKESHAVAINERGQVVGSSETKRGTTHAFLWENGRMIDLGALGGPDSEAVAINDSGQIVGSSRTKGSTDAGVYGRVPIEHAFLWENGRMRDLGTLDGRRSAALDINQQGQVVGWSTVKRWYRNGEPMRHAFLWADGKMRDLGVLRGGKESTAVAINDAGQVLAYSYYTEFDLGTTPGHNLDYGVAFVWQNGRKIALRKDTFPRAINEQGEVIGEIYWGGKQWMDDAGTGSDAQAFSWANGTTRTLRQWVSTGWTQGINEQGQIVGLQWKAGMRACIWQDNGALVPLPTLRGAHDSKAAAINDEAQIVGISGDQAVLWTLRPGN
jgi:probable HAF family extracellular repeat protein